MKKAVKIPLIILSVILSIFLILTLLFFSITKGVYIDEDKLLNSDVKINYYDVNNKLFYEESNGKEIAKFNEIPKNTINAFISIEDRRFYKHKGVDFKSLNRAFFNNLKSFSFKEGASTITQQLVKNTHLSSDKNITRKLKEIRLAKKLEKKYSKDEILEKYLNTIYFGDGCYGIKNASSHYFNKNVEDLSINESAILASIIKAPSVYSPTKNLDKNLSRKNLVLDKMHEEGYISIDEYTENKNKGVELNVKTNSIYDYKHLAKKTVNKLIENNPYNTKTLNVYTYLDAEIQENIDQFLNLDDVSAEKSIIILDKNNKIIAYVSTCGDVNRQIGSTIKPLVVHAPSLELGHYYLCSKIKDEKININGYSPSNFNDKYYGEVTFSESLEKSLNSPAVQILNVTGVENSINYLEKMNFELDDSDKNLSLALGSTKFGQKLSILSSSYSVFRDGKYSNPSVIREIKNSNNVVIFEDKTEKTEIFREDTANLIKKVLKDTVTRGTAKKLSFLPFEVCSKTGTVGNDKGNSDAYNISFNDDITVGVWYGNKKGEILDNNVLGGTFSTTTAKEIWEFINSKRTIPKKITISNLFEFEIDKPLYDEENVIMLADDVAPSRYKQKELFGFHAPTKKSTTFSNPKIETPKYTVNNNVFKLYLCQTKYYDCNVYVAQNNDKKLLYVKRPNEEFVLEYELLPNSEYTFIVTPFYRSNDLAILGDEIILAKIKTPPVYTDGDWWIDDI